MARAPMLCLAATLGAAAVACQLDSSGLGGGVATGEDAIATGSTDASAGSGPEATDGSASGTASPTTGTPATDVTGSTDGPTGTSTGDDPTDPDGSTTADPDPPLACTPILAEVLTSLDGSDDGREWVVLHNPCDAPFGLAPLSLAWGELSYENAVALVGVIPAGGCLTVGGPTTNNGNFNPAIHQSVNFDPNLSREPGAIGLFLSDPGDVDVGDVPLDVVVYGNSNAGGFLDPMGAMPDPMVRGNVDRVSMRRTSLGPTWEQADPPTPNACPSF